ncbi:LbtU family siderophore porin [Legionella quateirensis]|nr:LbtU family siderophore porin [Legionella quateirensis]
MNKMSMHRLLHFKNRMLMVFVLWISASNASATNLTPEQIDALIEETRSLRNEVVQLRRQLYEHTNTHKKTQTHKGTIKPRQTLETALKKSSNNKKASAKHNAKARTFIAPNHQGTSQNITLSKSESSSKQNADKSNSSGHTDNAVKQNHNVLTLGGIPVVISPYLGSPSAYDGSDLLTNISQQNGDLLALQYRQEIENAFSDSKAKASEYYLVLSGSLGAQIYNTRPYIGPPTNDIDLTTANITALAGMGSWVTGFFSFDYDNQPPDGLTPPQIGPREANSRVYLEQGYLSIGNLNKSDWYGSIGQMYLPFGQYNGFMINSPLTSTLFSTIERPILLGYTHSTDKAELDLDAYGYQGETVTSVIGNNTINEWGLSAQYTLTESNWNGGIGVGYISNIADAEGMQLNSQNSQFCTVFGGFAYPCGNGNILKHKVPGFDFNASYSINAYSFVAEYLTATTAFAIEDLSYNRHGAKPQAFDIEAAYSFTIFNKPSSIAIGYTLTRESLAFLLPAREYSLALNTSLWRNTTESLGFQHDVNYGIDDFATGQLLPVFYSASRANLGKTSDTVLFAINASF